MGRSHSLATYKNSGRELIADKGPGCLERAWTGTTGSAPRLRVVAPGRSLALDWA
jgi:hypothetical protein